MGLVDNDVVAARLIPGDSVAARNLVDFLVHALLELVALLLDAARVIAAGLLVYLVVLDFLQVSLELVQDAVAVVAQVLCGHAHLAERAHRDND